MKMVAKVLPVILFLSLLCSFAWADPYAESKKMFEDAGIAAIFESAYGYALFPTIGKAGFVVGGAYGEGRVFQQGKYIGNSVMTQATIGFQLGGAGFSQVIFFKDKRALITFIKGPFEFGAAAQATALTAAVGLSANTGGSSATASGTMNNATIRSAGYNYGMAIFTITKGGLMYEASIGGQKFTFSRR